MNPDPDPTDPDGASVVQQGTQADLVAGLAELTPQVLDEVVLQTVRDTHVAIADRVFGLVPGSGLPRTVHDTIAGLVYRTLGTTVGGVKAAATGLAALTGPSREPQALERSAAWRRTVAILNGVLGDVLEDDENPLALRMTIRVNAKDVALEPAALTKAFPDAGPRVAVLLHGLVENDESWDFDLAERPQTYPNLLSAGGVTPVVLRYNSGRHISTNAADLDRLLADLCRAWPVDINEIVLIGHSMGGLVIRGAGEHALMVGRAWPDLVSHVVTLGAPHGGAPLEKLANSGAWLLSAVPEMAPFGKILRRRSAGIKDLRHGYITDEDWHGQDPDALRSRRARAVAATGKAAHHVVGATLGATDRHPLSWALGDVMVRWDSARGHGHEWAQVAELTHIGSANHFSLLNHGDVAAILTSIIEGLESDLTGP